MISEILHKAKDFNSRVAELKKHSPYYPDFLRAVNDNEVYFSTKIRKEFNGKWFTIHCMESIIPNKKTSEFDCLKRLMLSAYHIEHLYILSGFEDEDSLQISEIERLSNNLPR